MKKLFANGEQGFFYDPNDLSTMYQDAAGTVPVTGVGQLVGLIRDKSGRNNHAFQTTSASRPILRKNAVTGANYLEFDGSDDFLRTSEIDFTATDKVSLFTGVRKLSDSTASMVVSTGSDYTLTGAFGLYCGGAAGAYSYSFAALGTAAQYLKPADAAPSSNVMTVKVNSAIPNITLVSNSMTKVSVNLGSKIKLGNYPMYIGRNGGSSFPFNGHIYSLIGIGRLTTDAETIALEKSIAKNTGVTLSV